MNAFFRFKLGLLGMVFFGAFLFILIPLICFKIDRALNLPSPLPFPFNLIGILLFVLGFILCIECIKLFFSIGKGTPSPIAPPKKLIVEGPYRYTRNPMVTGVFITLISLALFIRSLSFLSFLFFLLLPFGILFIKLYEEKDLEERFKGDYIAYKKKTPFLIPHYQYLLRWIGFFILSFFKGVWKALLVCHLFFTFWRKIDECFNRKDYLKDYLDREDLFWVPPWAGFFGQIQRVLLFIVPPIVFTGYGLLLIKEMPFILTPLFTQLIDIWVERRFLSKKIEDWARSMEG